ncbi:hypothetical protein C8R44DRAFT_891296 [Mycena epipterygia]|nr:hypothetical protein C8R44DRAFT_891296 [Mycena epipterygia]
MSICRRKGQGLVVASSSSCRISIKATNYSASGRPVTTSRNLNPTKRQALKEDQWELEHLRLQNLTSTERRAEDTRNDFDTINEDYGGPSDMLGDVLDGTAPQKSVTAGKHKRRDYCTRRDRTQALMNAFKPQMEAIADAYLAWDLGSSSKGLGTLVDPSADAMVQGVLPTMVVDLFSARIVDIPLLAGDAFVASGLVNLGYFPCSADFPTVVLTTRVLEIYRVARLRCPWLAIQPYVRSLCDIHGAAFRPYLSTQFSIAFNLYLATLAIVEQRVKHLLGRDAPNWRLKNVCPTCMYKLEDEPVLDLPILTTMDGNNSLKRFHRRERTEGGAAGVSKEREDSRQVPGDYYISPEEVDEWGKEELEELLKGFTPDPAWEEAGDGYSDRWENMKEHVTAKAWGMYDETGVFLSLCRHGFVLFIADMIRSGEL